MKRDLIKDILQRSDYGVDVTICGWVRTRRESKGGFSFIELNDGSCFANIQIVADADLPNYDEEINKLFPGASIRIDGELVESPGEGQAVEIKAKTIKVFGFCEPTEYPLGKQRVSFERLREIAHLRSRTNSFGAVARVRNALAAATHKFYQDRGFLYVHTPIITGSDCEGAGEMFQVTSLDLADPPKTDKGEINYNEDFFGRKTSLTVSGQLEGETYACAFGNIYTFGHRLTQKNIEL